MTTPPDHASGLRRATPWVVAVVLAALVVLLALAIPHVRAVSDRAEQAADAPQSVSLPTSYAKAVLDASTEAANLLTYSRKNFDSDWQRALDGSTGALKSDQMKKKSQTLSQMTKGKIDLKGTVAQAAFEAADDKGQVLVMITINGYVVNDAGERSAQTPQRLELTMVQSGDKWLANNLTSVGIQ